MQRIKLMRNIIYDYNNQNMNNETIKPKPIKRYNLILERDENVDSGYIYIQPFSHKNPPRITSNKQIGDVIFDYVGDKICGIEILEFSEKVFTQPNHSNNGNHKIVESLDDLNEQIKKIQNQKNNYGENFGRYT